MGRKILFITTDQMRFDAIGANGQKIARTPNIDALAKAGINYTRCHAQNVVCMPARATMITGQYVTTHGVWMNGVPLPEDAPSVARLLKEKKGYRTALIGKAHFEPMLDLQLKFAENRMGRARGTDDDVGLRDSLIEPIERQSLAIRSRLDHLADVVTRQPERRLLLLRLRRRQRHRRFARCRRFGSRYFNEGGFGGRRRCNGFFRF